MKIVTKPNISLIIKKNKKKFFFILWIYWNMYPNYFYIIYNILKLIKLYYLGIDNTNKNMNFIFKFYHIIEHSNYVYKLINNLVTLLFFYTSNKVIFNKNNFYNYKNYFFFLRK